MNTELMHVDTALYRFYDHAGALLYVGITHNVDQRWASHARNQPWWLDVARKTIEWHPNRSVAEKLESEALEREKPLYDRSGKRWEQSGVVDARLTSEVDRAVEILGSSIARGKFPAWKVMPTIRDLSDQFRIPLAATTKALGQLEHEQGLIVRFADRFVPGSPSAVPRGARKYGGVYILASQHFEANPFSIPQLAAASGYAASTVEQHLRKLVKAQVVEKQPLCDSGDRLFRVVVPPIPDQPEVLRVWGWDHVYALAEWLTQQVATDQAADPRDREIIEACLPDEYGVSNGGVRVLKLVARRYRHRTGCRPEWGII